MEVRVHERLLQPPWIHDGADEHAERVRRRQLEQAYVSVELDPARSLQSEPGRSGVQVPWPERGRGAVGIAETCGGRGDRGVQVPAAPAEDRRSDPGLQKPGALTPDLLGGGPVPRTGVPGPAPVRVVPERPAGGGLAGTFEPEVGILAGTLVGRTHERRDPEAAGCLFLQPREPPPGVVVERTLDVARDDGVAFPLEHGRCGL